MDLNSVSSNKVVLNIRTPQGGEVPLNKGEVLQTQVQDVGEDGLVTIMVKGKLIEAAAEVPVKPGQQLLLMVDDVRNGKTYLRVVTPEMMGKIENTNISAHLLDMGIAAKDDTILLSRKLLQYNLPVNQSSLNELNKNIKMLGGMNARNLEIAAFALSRGITGKPALESLAQFFAPQADTAKLVPVLGSILDALAAPQLGKQPGAGNRSVSTNPSLQMANAEGEEAGKNISKPSPVGTKTSTPEETRTTMTAGDKNTLDPVKGETINSRTSSNKLAEPINTGNRLDPGGKPNSSSTTPGTVLENEAGPSVEILSEKDVPKTIDKSAQAMNAAGKFKEVAAANVSQAAQQSENIEPTQGKQGAPASSAANKNSASEGVKTQTVTIVGSEESPDPVKGAAISEKNTGSKLNYSASQSEGEELNNTSKLASARNPTVTSEEAQRGSNAAPAANKAAAGQANADANGAKTLISSGNTAAEKTGPGNETPALNLKAERSAGENSIQNQSPGTADKNAKSISSGNKSEATVKNSAPAVASKVEEQLPGLQAAKATIINKDPSSMPGTLAAPANDESLGTAVSSPPPGGGSELELPRDSLSRNISNLLDTLRGLLEINPEDPPDRIAGKIQDAVSSEKDIIKALTLLKDIVDSKDIAEKLPQLKDFSQRLNSLEKEITGQQLFNISSKNSGDNMSSYYFSFPVPIDQGYSLCQLQINKDSRQKLRDVDKLSLVVSLNTAKLGMVLYHVNWQKAGQLELQGVVENQSSCTYLNKNQGELVKNLEALGYRVKDQGVKVSSSPEEIRSLKPVLQEVIEPLRPLGIDVTV